MASTDPDTSERTPLLTPQPLSPTDTSKKASRNVTFDPVPLIKTIGASESESAQTSEAPFNPINTRTATTTNGTSSKAKPRRRHSYGASLAPIPTVITASKIGPQRTTKNVQKLKLLPDPDFGEDGPDEESGRDVYSQYTRIKDPTARRDAARLGKADKDRLPRVTAYCTANKYQLERMMRFLKGNFGKKGGANPKLFDECIYTPFRYGKASRKEASDRAMEVHSAPVKMRDRRHSDSAIEVEDNNKQRRDDLISLHTDGGEIAISNGELSPANHLLPEVIARQMENETHALISESNPDFDTQIHTPELFLFGYGVVVIWGMSVAQEEQFLEDIARFESEKLAPDDIEMESFNFYYTKEYQARVYNDFITLREKGNYMTKLAISHAIAQSVKVFNSDLILRKLLMTNPRLPFSSPS